LRRYCRRFDFRCFRGVYGPDDLCQDLWLTIWKHRDELDAPENILSERDLESWFFVVSRNHYLNRVRQNAKAGTRVDVDIEDIEIPMEDDYSDKYFLSRFHDFIQRYSESRQLSIQLWLEGFSYREIAAMLHDRDVQCSYVTVRSWITNVLDDFRRTLEVFD